MELHELHVDELGPCLEGEGVAVPGVLPGVRRDLERLADAAAGEHHRLGAEHDEAAVLAPVGKRTNDTAAVDEEARDRALHEDLEALVDAVVLKRADHLEPRAVSDVGEPRSGVPAEVPLEDSSVLGAVEDGAPVLELAHAVGRFLGVELRHTPVVELLAAEHGVAEMDLPGVLGIHVRERRGDAPLGHHRVRLAEERLADHAGAWRPRPTLRSRRAVPRPPRR